jgi:GTP-binding protein HflX
VLSEIGASDVSQILVCNKVDRLDDNHRPRQVCDVLQFEGGRRVPRVFVSALTGMGLDALRAALAQACRVADMRSARPSDAPELPLATADVRPFVDSEFASALLDRSA